MTDKRTIVPADLLKIAAAFSLTVGLLLFLVATRLVRNSETPTLTLRSIERIDHVSLPAPPPPPSTETPPPPPPPNLPKLNIELDSIAPPVKATQAPELELRLETTEFAPMQDLPMEQMTFASSDLDSQPRLINRPSVTFPATQRNLGVNEGRVILEVMISSAGTVTVKRVLETTHEDFTAMARSFATRARFTPPKKEGRSVNALFKWPLILKP